MVAPCSPTRSWRACGVPGDRPGGAVPVLHPDPADSAFIDPGRGRGPADRLGLAVAVCTLPWLGFVPDDVASAPPGTGGPDTPATDIRIAYACAD